jgi:hypothetical protein
MRTSDEREQRRATRRFPDFFVVGHPKCGTSAMYEMLRQHPQVFMSPIKEPRYFNDDLNVPTETRMTESEYLKMFRGADHEQRLGEASPGYLRSYVAPGRIAAVNSDARIIAILREPASFIHSLHLQGMRNGRVLTRDLRAVLDADESRPDMLQFGQYVKYVEQLERYRAVFPPGQVLVLVYEDYRRENAQTMRQVFRFIGVDDAFEVEPTVANPSGVRSLRLAALWAHFRDSEGPAYSALRRTAKLTSTRQLHYRVRQTYRRFNTAPPPPADPELLAELRRRFTPEVVRLSEYIGRDLCALWGYPTG